MVAWDSVASLELLDLVVERHSEGHRGGSPSQAPSRKNVAKRAADTELAKTARGTSHSARARPREWW